LTELAVKDYQEHFTIKVLKTALQSLISLTPLPFRPKSCRLV